MKSFDWESIKSNPDVRDLYEELTDFYDNNCDKTCEAVLPYSKYAMFRRNGNRSVFEKDYFLRRKRLVAETILYLAKAREIDIDTIQDLIWAICDEYAWALPAHLHVADDDFSRRTTIDLFSSDTAYMLSEISLLLKDHLDAEVSERIKAEIEKRLVEPFIQRAFGWETIHTNWAAVCACFTGCTFINLFPEKLPLILPRIHAAMQSFLEGFLEDGACQEGVSYWFYGFGRFCQFYDCFSAVDPSALKIFEDEKVKNIALFYQRACLEDAVAMTFADCQPQALYEADVLFFLRSVYGDEIKIPPLCYRRKGVISIYPLTRGFARFDLTKIEKDIANFSYYFPKSQIYVHKKDAYSFAAKGGYNEEPHNHNDIGSFLTVVNGEQILCDIGVGTYDRDYFDNSVRFNLLGNGSQGHSVPIIDGKYQQFGREYTARDVSYENGVFSMDIAGAYDGLDGRIVREFKIAETGFILTDTYDLKDRPQSIVERFVSYQKPEIEEGCLCWDGLKMYFDAKNYKPSVSSEKYRNNFKGVFDVWLIDLEAVHPQNDSVFQSKIVICKGEGSKPSC